jgi:hypothetical protein
MHGASAPQAIAKATERIEQAAIIQAARTFGLVRDDVSEEQAPEIVSRHRRLVGAT